MLQSLVYPDTTDPCSRIIVDQAVNIQGLSDQSVTITTFNNNLTENITVNQPYFQLLGPDNPNTNIPGSFLAFAKDNTGKYLRFCGEPNGKLSYNDICMSNIGMPSGKKLMYDQVASGTKMYAPAGGYIYFSMISGASGEYINISCIGIASSVYATAKGQALKVFVPIKEKNGFDITYTCTGELRYLFFEYAIGSEWMYNQTS